ncbi:MAG TPA: methyltransferase [Puia sp.]|nr:methyltransferase [Puia sp.]
MQNNNTPPAPSPESILRIGMGFWPSKVLLTAVKFQLFTLLAQQQPLSAGEIKKSLNLHTTDRHVYDLLDALTGLGFLQRTGLLEQARYSNSPDTNIFLDKNKPSYIGGILELANRRLYNSWGRLDNAMLTGQLQDHDMADKGHSFEEVYGTPDKLKEFLDAMSGINMANFRAFATKFDFSGYKTLTDAGGAGGHLSITIAQQHPHITCTSFDLPIVEPLAVDNIQRAGIDEKVHTASGDFFTEPIPSADVIVMANILHDWEEEKKLHLIQQAYNALPPNGVFAAIEHVIDDQRTKNVFGMMMSLNMLVQTGKGFDYTFSDFQAWANAVGFVRTELLPLTERSSAVLAYKS